MKSIFHKNHNEDAKVITSPSFQIAMLSNGCCCVHVIFTIMLLILGCDNDIISMIGISVIFFFQFRLNYAPAFLEIEK